MSIRDLLYGNRPKIDPNTPGINPNAPPVTSMPSVFNGSPMPKQGLFDKADAFLQRPGGNFLMNLLAQDGYSTMPGSPLGAVGKAGLMTREQQQQAEQLKAQAAQRELQQQLIRSQIGLTDARTKNTLAGPDGSEMTPAEVRTFEAMTQNLTPEQKEDARQVALGLKPRAGISSQERIVSDPALAALIKKYEADIAGATREATDQAATDVKNREELPAQIARDEEFIDRAEGFRASLKDGSLDTGWIIGKFPAVTTQAQLFEAFAGENVLNLISSVTLGALSKGELDFLKASTIGRGNTEDANIDMLERKIAIIRDANKRARAKLGSSSGGSFDRPLSEMTNEELEAIARGE